MKIYTTVICIGIFFFTLRGNIHSQQKKIFYGTDTSKSWVKRISQGDGMKLWMSNDLVLGKAAFHGNPPSHSTCGNIPVGWEYPTGSCLEHLNGAGPFIGGIINGIRCVSTAYDGTGGRTEFTPARKDSLRNRFWVGSRKDTAYNSSRSGYYKRPMNILCYDDDGDGTVDEDALDGEDNDRDWNKLTDDLGVDGVGDRQEIGCRGTYDPTKNPDPSFDNYELTGIKHDTCRPNAYGVYPSMKNKDLYTEGNGIPDHGEPHVDEDDAAISDQDVYVSATDTFAGTPSLIIVLWE
ncbi:MAG: hypothetical protein HYZ34_00955 [Ignavibacteriae bacterium]|nr:hypothetical protein [Ignavibacteriota bacterium]